MKQLILKSVLILFSISVFISCKNESIKPYTAEEIAKESKKVNAFFQKSFDRAVDNNLKLQASLGIKKNYGKLNDDSPAAAKRELAIKKNELVWLTDSVNVALLPKDVLLSYTLFKQGVENSIEDYKYRLHNYPVTQMFGPHAKLPAFLINNHRIDNISDAQNYISRLNGFDNFFLQVVENLKAREEIGVIPPKFIYDKAIQTSENILLGQPFDKTNKKSTLLKDFLKKIDKLDIDSKAKKALEENVRRALLISVKPAYTRLISFLKEQKQRANTNDGVWKFPNGKAYYNLTLQRRTTTNLTAEEIHNLGLKEVKRIHREMKVIMKQVKFNGSLQQFFQFMRNDKQFYYTNDKKGKDAYLAKAVFLIDSMKTRLDEIFITKPKANIMVKAVEPFREKSAGGAFYTRPAANGSRPGIYYANLYNMKAMPKYQMEALAYHEGIPGHHMQRAIQQELKGIPKFRKFGDYTAYTEGWGLYSEFLPKEMGFYTDPYSDFGRLAMELWRACRLVVDTGIHAKKWTREEGIKYYTDNTPNDKSKAIKMVERHIVMPGQATAYKIGMLKILELRKKAKDNLGNAFDIREFHEVILSNGAIPLNVLEDFVDEYITSKK